MVRCLVLVFCLFLFRIGWIWLSLATGLVCFGFLFYSPWKLNDPFRGETWKKRGEKLPERHVRLNSLGVEF